MAISETSLRDVLLFTFDEINENGGILGKQIEPVVVDGASDWPLFAEKAEQLLAKDKVASVFGCWTSVSRKSVLPVFEKYNGLLFYPVQYEGEELSHNIFYTAEAVNQQATPAVDFLLKEIDASGLSSDDCPIVSFSLSEDEFRSLPTQDLVGHLGCWTYFMSIDTPANKSFQKKFQRWLSGSNITGVVKEDRVTCSPMVLSYNGVYIWKAVVEKAGTFETEAVIKALEDGVIFDGPGGRVISQRNHHLTKNVYIGEILEDGQFSILEEFNNVYGEPFLKGKF